MDGAWAMVKRLVDIVISAAALIILSPLLFIVALLVRQKLGRPVLFAQVRPGLKGAPFRMIKFRTMTAECDSNGNLLPDAARLPKFGLWLRASSIDELPGLWNVLIGDMTLVGPRPLLMQYLPLYSPEQARRHQVRPGLTGWAQINGRNALTWEQKFELDTWYVDNGSFWLDMKILIITAFKVVKRDGINADSDVTMPVFTGSKGNECND
jgi:lipopolysaccharide/colanic/teichoic acid biosynthesis glycosyltransferase